MEKLDKKKVLAVVLIIALIAALVGAVTLLYNSIELLTYTNFRDGNKVDSYYYDLQKPTAIILLVAGIVALLGVAVGIISFVAKHPKIKIVLVIVGFCIVAAFLMLIITAAIKWNGFYGEEYEKYLGFPNIIPVFSNSQNYQVTAFGIYSGAMSSLVPQLVYFVIIAAVLLTVYLIDIKAAKANAVKINDINSENKGE